MLVCSLYKFRLENGVDSKYLLTNSSSDYSGYCIIKRGKEIFKSPTRKLTETADGLKSLALQSSFEISDVGERRRRRDAEPTSSSLALTASEGDLFAASMQEEHETDVITLAVRIYGKTGTQVYNVTGFLNISDYKQRPEKRHDISLRMHKQPLVSALSDAHSADGILSMQLIYTADNEHPSLLNFIACGLFLCPATTPLDRGPGSGLGSIGSSSIGGGSIENGGSGGGGRASGGGDRGSRGGGSSITDACMSAAMCGSGGGGGQDYEGGAGGAVDYTGDMPEETREGDQRLRHHPLHRDDGGQDQGQEQGRGGVKGQEENTASQHQQHEQHQQHQQHEQQQEYSFASEFLRSLQSWPMGAAPAAPAAPAASAPHPHPHPHSHPHPHPHATAAAAASAVAAGGVRSKED